MATLANGEPTRGTVAAWFTFHTASGRWIPEGEVGCEEVSGLMIETEEIVTKQGNDLFEDKVAGRTKAGAVTIKVAVTKNTRFEEWIAAIRENSALGDESAREDAYVTMYDRRGAPGSETPAEDAVQIRQWLLQKAWPSKIEYSALTGTANELATMTVTLAMYGPPLLIYPLARP